MDAVGLLLYMVFCFDINILLTILNSKLNPSFYRNWSY